MTVEYWAALAAFLSVTRVSLLVSMKFCFAYFSTHKRNGVNPLSHNYQNNNKKLITNISVRYHLFVWLVLQN
jgi:hypothetical protein